MTTPATAQAQRLYTVADAAKQIDVSIAYIYKRIKDGSLPYVDLGKGTGRAKTRIRASDLDAFIEERTFSDAPTGYAA
ncbi:helix-turn-helix domain-containing protein [Kocuria sp. TGY1127_2]|uniref:helix-turn-helix domain-containing protein n=1 Tax=Kocuria sp. TGY1127_2 TaxID=2711328 RepID=UPI0015BD7E19|nr:helix-turn-helix domain-containing protein [Kocuria sp. TGY1127_2]